MTLDSEDLKLIEAMFKKVLGQSDTDAEKVSHLTLSERKAYWKSKRPKGSSK